MVPRTYWVYIMASERRTLYIGVTDDITRRVAEHKSGQGSEFTARYHVDRLVYAASFSDVRDALTYEKQLKGWTRARKITLIEATNPTWEDLIVR